MWYAPCVDASSTTLEARPVILLSTGSAGRATVRVVDHQGTLAVLKDFSSSSAGFRRVCGAYLARREAAAYRRLRGVTGVPRLLRRVRPDGLLIEYMEGRNCVEIGGGDLAPAFFADLQSILRDVRARGVLHGDVKRNVVCTPEGRPVLVDFAASLVLPAWLPPLPGWTARLAERYDERAVAKLKARAAPQLVTPEDEQLLGRTLPLERLLKLGERLLRRVTHWIMRREARSRERGIALPLHVEPSDESPESSRAS